MCRATAQGQPRQLGKTAPPATTPLHRGRHPGLPCADMAARCAAALGLPPRGNPSQKQRMQRPQQRQARVRLQPSSIPPRAARPPTPHGLRRAPRAPLSGSCSCTEAPREQVPDWVLTLKKKSPKAWERGTKPPWDALGHTRAHRLYHLGLASRCPEPRARAELRGVCPQEGPQHPFTAGRHPHLQHGTPSCRSVQGSKASCRQQGTRRRGSRTTPHSPGRLRARLRFCHVLFSVCGPFFGDS